MLLTMYGKGHGVLQPKFHEYVRKRQYMLKTLDEYREVKQSKEKQKKREKKEKNNKRKGKTKKRVVAGHLLIMKDPFILCHPLLFISVSPQTAHGAGFTNIFTEVWKRDTLFVFFALRP